MALRCCVVSIVLLAPLLGAGLTASAALADLSFVYETAHPAPPSVGGYTSIALDAGNDPHVSYHDFSNGDLRYAVRRDGAWSTSMVDSAGLTGRETSLALDAQGRPHISYRDVTNEDLRYAVKDGETWVTETVDAPGDLGQATSIAVDAQGNPHIAYHDYPDALKYAVKVDGSWTLTTIDSAGARFYISLALDSSGEPHIGYADLGADDSFLLRYTHRSEGMWQSDVVDTGFVGQAVSLALDAQDHPHISYRDPDDGHLKYAVKSDGTWTVEIVDTAGSGPSYSSIAVDPEGDPHVSYYFASTHSLHYAVRRDGAWTTQVADPFDGSGRGEFNSIAVDSDGDPHISYEAPGLSLKYATAEASASVGTGPRYTGVRLLGSAPNPFSGRTLIRYAVPAPGATITLDVYDARGRLVRTLLEGSPPPGPGSVAWDGRDAGGRPLGSGVYYFRLESRGRVESGAVLILR